MAWLIGIDEAGYGPNLGPLVVTVVACRCPELDVDPWRRLRSCVRRATDDADDRVLVADSKQVYSTARGLAALEQGVLALLADFFDEGPALRHLLEKLVPNHSDELSNECWYHGETALPVAEEAPALMKIAGKIRRALSKAEIGPFWCRSIVACTPRINAVVDRWDSKAVILGLGLVQLVRDALDATTPEPTHFLIDKHGGRNRYTSLLQEAFSDGIVLTEVEGAEESSYQIRNLDRATRVSIMPRADDAHFPVALASMVSKYVRELLMVEFNAFWQRHIPGLKATAGYPGDSRRYYDEIRPAMSALGLAEHQVWRCR